MDFFSSTWPRAFMITTAVQAAVCLGFEVYTFAKFQQKLGFFVDTDETNLQYRTILTFLTLFIFAFIYELVLVWDALRMGNIIQVVGVCMANIAMMVFTALQLETIEITIDLLEEAHHPALRTGNAGLDLMPFLVAIPCVVTLGTITMILMTWKLHQEFAWDILKHIGADYHMTKRLLHYQIYITLLKFDLFFFLGFTIQFLVVATDKNNVEFGLTIAAIPITIALLLLAAFFTCRENKFGMVAIIVIYFGGLVYFLLKLVRIYQPSHAQFYIAVRKSLTAFAVLTIVLIVATIINAFICMNNFGTGLKRHLLGRSNLDVDKSDMDSINLQHVEPQLRSRMSIE